MIKSQHGLSSYGSNIVVVFCVRGAEYYYYNVIDNTAGRSLVSP
jgi:hypothetical protein